MRKLRRIGIPIILLAVLLSAFVTPASAYVPDVTATVDKNVTTPGDFFTTTITFTNTQATPVNFVYLSASPDYGTWAWSGSTYYTMVSCTGDVSWCQSITTGPQAALALHLTVPIPPGGTRTATVTYQVTPDSGCYTSLPSYGLPQGSYHSIQSDFYYYYEFTDATGAFASVQSGFVGPGTDVYCAGDAP